ncbi:MAG: hypothetical protein JXQ72_06295 [Anaerolineae bacterium]|nr:hypothetical protein [Anaerolineae bacterium]
MSTDPKSVPPNPEPQDGDKPEIFAVSGKVNEPEFNRRDFLNASGVVVAGTLAASAVGVSLAGGDSLQTASTPTRTPRPTRTPIPEPCTVRTSEQEVNVHVGPGRHRGIRDYMPVNEDVPVIGKGKNPQDANGPYWWKIELYDYDEAWVHPDDVEASGDCDVVDDVDAPPIRTQSAPQATAAPTDAPVPTGIPGSVPAGQTGINYTGSDGRTYTLPCGAPIPPGAVCVCNCVTVPAGCSCHTYRPCSCAGASHYWYPN